MRSLEVSQSDETNCKSSNLTLDHLVAIVIIKGICRHGLELGIVVLAKFALYSRAAAPFPVVDGAHIECTSVEG